MLGSKAQMYAFPPTWSKVYFSELSGDQHVGRVGQQHKQESSRRAPMGTACLQDAGAGIGCQVGGEQAVTSSHRGCTPLKGTPFKGSHNVLVENY